MSQRGTSDSLQTGTSSGWSVSPAGGRWAWQAWFQGTSRNGTAQFYLQAEHQAREALNRLKQQFGIGR